MMVHKNNSDLIKTNEFYRLVAIMWLQIHRKLWVASHIIKGRIGIVSMRLPIT